MPRITLYGSSDDLIEVERHGHGEDLEFNTERGQLILTGDGRTTRVTMEYGEMGVWTMKVEQVDEGMPTHACSLTGEGYTMRGEFEGVDFVTLEARA